jgi:hypothetical protein
LVFIYGPFALGAQEHPEVDEAFAFSQELPYQFCETVIPGEAGNLRMEFGIRAYKFSDRIPTAFVITEPAQFPEARQSCRLMISRSQRGRGRLEQQPQIKKLLHIPKRYRSNRIAMTGRDPGQALQNQTAQGLSGGGLTDPQSLRNGSLSQTFSRRESTFNNGEAKAVIGFFGEGVSSSGGGVGREAFSGGPFAHR